MLAATKCLAFRIYQWWNNIVIVLCGFMSVCYCLFWARIKEPTFTLEFNIFSAFFSRILSSGWLFFYFTFSLSLFLSLSLPRSLMHRHTWTFYVNWCVRLCMRMWFGICWQSMWVFIFLVQWHFGIMESTLINLPVATTLNYAQTYKISRNPHILYNVWHSRVQRKTKNGFALDFSHAHTHPLSLALPPPHSLYCSVWIGMIAGSQTED